MNRRNTRGTLAAALLCMTVVVPVSVACAPPAGDTEQVEESDQVSGDAEETEADSDNEE